LDSAAERYTLEQLLAQPKGVSILTPEMQMQALGMPVTDSSLRAPLPKGKKAPPPTLAPTFAPAGGAVSVKSPEDYGTYNTILGELQGMVNRSLKAKAAGK
jgi:hypothetical protein